MVVVLIIAILLAIALPSYMSSRDRAQDGAAQALVRLALSAEIVHQGSFAVFSDDNAVGGALDTIEPDINWGAVDATLKGVTASFSGGDDQTIILRSQSRTGTMFCLGRLERGATAGTYFTTGCDGTETPAVIATWPTSFGAGWGT